MLYFNATFVLHRHHYHLYFVYAMVLCMYVYEYSNYLLKVFKILRNFNWSLLKSHIHATTGQIAVADPDLELRGAWS